MLKYYDYKNNRMRITFIILFCLQTQNMQKSQFSTSQQMIRLQFRLFQLKLLIQSDFMIQNDIDLLEQDDYRDPYYFCLKLLTLKKNKRKTNRKRKISNFKFIIQQDDYVIDQTKEHIVNVFQSLQTTTMSLNNQILHFYIQDIKQSNAQFQLKMYIISHEQVEEQGNMTINTLTYIEVFLQDGKTIFRETVSLCDGYSLEYQVYVGKSIIEVENLIKDSEGQNFVIKNAFKKKGGEIIQIQNQKVQVKEKSNADRQTQILRKSLHFNKNKLIQIQNRRKLSLKQNTSDLSQSRSSFLSKIGTMIKNTVQQINEMTIFSTQQNPRKQTYESQRSMALSPPVIGPHKFYKPQNKQFYHSLNLQRQKQKQRLQKYLKNPHSNQSELKQKLQYSWVKMLKIVAILILFSLVMYFLVIPNKKTKSKVLAKLDVFRM